MTQAFFDAQTDLLTGLSTFYTDEAARLVDDVSAAAVCGYLAGMCDAAADITEATDVNWELRRGAMESAAASYQAACQPTLHDRLQSLQFNGVEIDTELIRIFLFGQNLVAMPNP